MTPGSAGMGFESLDQKRKTLSVWITYGEDVLYLATGLVFMLVELLQTIRVSIQEPALEPQPFLIVSLIAGVRRVLILPWRRASSSGTIPRCSATSSSSSAC